MDTVINAAKLLLVVGLGFVYLLGQGWLVVGPLLYGSLIRRNQNIALLNEIPLTLVSGLILNYGLVLCVQSVNISLVIGGIFSVAGFCCLITSILRDPARLTPSPTSFKTYFAFAFVCILFLGPILADPLNDWDARSIWFFHAKLIYTAGSIGLSAGWQHPSVFFSHTDYPNLIPALAAQVANVMGLWNEYLPKFSLFFMLVPAAAWLFTFARRSFSFTILLFLVPFGFSNWLWNGYMDGYLALFFSIALLLSGRYIKSSQPVDLISSAACFIILLSIKNEGALAAVSGLGAILLIGIFSRNSISIQKIRSLHWKYILIGVIALAPFFLWTQYAQQWNSQNNLEIGTPQSVVRIMERLSDGSYKAILKSVFKQNEGALLLLGTVYFASAAWNIKFPNASLPALVAAVIYTLGMIVVYLLTPSDLAWHMNTSIDRTMLAVSGCIFVGSYFILDAVENHEGVASN